MGFHVLIFATSYGRFYQMGANPEVFNISRGTWQMLMHCKKTMFNCYYGINSAKHSLKICGKYGTIFCHGFTVNMWWDIVIDISLQGPSHMSLVS